MPLLSNKLYILNKIRKDKKDEEPPFFHSLTNEICESEDEFKRKTFLYNQKIWTCRITGQINLTFKEALKSEQSCAKMLKNSFKKCFEAAVLQFVHHSKESLDTLIHKAWTQIHQEFCVNEPVNIKLTAPKEMTLKGIVIKVDRSKSTEDKDQENSPIKLNSDASSSDKENIKKKFIPVKKNFFYCVKIFEMDKLVKDIPAETIDRTLRPPSKDQIRMFIRAHAVRHSGKQNYPWVVDEDLVKKYRLPVLEPEFVLDKNKMKELSYTTEVQVYNKMKEESADKPNDITVDLTKSDDDDEKSAHKTIERNKEANRSRKKLKQTTLFDIPMSTTQTVPQRNQLRSPLSSPTRSLPPLAQRLLKLSKDNPNDPTVKQLVFKCCQLFSIQQISKFPDLIKIPIKARKEKLDEKKRLDAMSPEEREAFMITRRNQMRQLMREKKREENFKVEDNEIEYTKAIPKGTKVPVPTGLTQDQWARLVSIAEFVRCYKRLLMPTADVIKDTDMLLVDELCRSVLADSAKDHAMLAELVCVLLKTLMQDNRVRNRREMNLALNELPVTACTAGELLRLVLPLGDEKRDARYIDDADNDNDDPEDIRDRVDEGEVIIHSNNEIADPICEKLASIDLHELSPEDKISVLELLQSRILEMDVVSSFIDDYQREVVEAYKKKLSDTKELNDKIKLVRQNKQNMSRLITTSGQQPNEQGVDQGASLEESSQVARRRQSIEQKQKECEEKERRLEKERQIQKLEKDELAYKRSIELCQKAYNTAMNDAKQLMRVASLGTDRNFRRYWYFPTAPGAIYVETETSSIGGQEPPLTFWTMYVSVDEVSDVVKSLCEKGVRESLLRSELEATFPRLKEDIDSAMLRATCNTGSNIGIARSDQDSFLVEGFKKELNETELSIRQGSLGGVEDYDSWHNTLMEASSLSALKQALVTVFLGVHERFWNAPMKTVNGRTDFLSAVDDAKTQGRLNVLQSYLDACVCWKKSAKDDKCRVCRKNSDENAMLLCDSCNLAFHTFCLRPPLHEIPDGEWFCPHCKPVSRARDQDGHADCQPAVAVNTASNVGPVSRSLKTRAGGAGEQCCVCRVSNNEPLAKCTSCNKCFHALCHDPALRQIRRMNWHCCECRLDEVANHKIRQGNTRRGSQTNWRAVEDDQLDNSNVEDNVDDDQDDDGNSDKITDKKSVAKKTVVKKLLSKNKSEKYEKSNGLVKRKKPMHDVDGEDDSERLIRPNRKRSRLITKDPIDTVNNKTLIPSDEDESDQDVQNLSTLLGKRTVNKRSSAAISENASTVATVVNASPVESHKRSRTGVNGATMEDQVEKACQSMLKLLINHKASWPFREPVDPKEVPDYYEIISEPMNLVKMLDKSKTGAYRIGGEKALRRFLADIGQIFFNAEVYNLPDSKIMGLSTTLEQFFKGIYSKYDFGIEYSRMTE